MEQSTKIVGEEISSYRDGLAFALTNPIFTSPTGFMWKRTWTPQQEAFRLLMSKGIIYQEEHFVDVEQAYQTLKKFYHPGENILGLSTTDDLMIDLISIKLSTYPLLITGIDERGGVEYLSKCTHQPTKVGSYWETSGGNGFIKCLIQAYSRVKAQEEK